MQFSVISKIPWYFWIVLFLASNQYLENTDTTFHKERDKCLYHEKLYHRYPQEILRLSTTETFWKASCMKYKNYQKRSPFLKEKIADILERFWTTKMNFIWWVHENNLYIWIPSTDIEKGFDISYLISFHEGDIHMMLLLHHSSMDTHKKVFLQTINSDLTMVCVHVITFQSLGLMWRC